MDAKWYRIGRGLAGWNALGIDVSSSGGDFEKYLKGAVEGALVYDAKDLKPNGMRAFTRLVIDGPLADPKLGLGEFSKFGKEHREAMARIKPLLSDGFKTLAKLAENEEYSGLDSVGLGIYKELLRKVPGIRIGHVLNGKVVWEQ